MDRFYVAEPHKPKVSSLNTIRTNERMELYCFMAYGLVLLKHGNKII
jgi:hypothetical protein